jgi:hypothetical protein
METSTDPTPRSAAAHAPAPAGGDDAPEPDAAQHAREAIEDHHFQRPTVSPVDASVRTMPRGG